jgi:hypothetical protein
MGGGGMFCKQALSLCSSFLILFILKRFFLYESDSF